MKLLGLIFRVLITGFTALLNLFPTIVAWGVCREVLGGRSGRPYHLAEISYGPAVFLVLWVFLAWGCIFASLRKDARSSWLAVPLMAGLMGGVGLGGYLQDFYPYEKAHWTVVGRMRRVQIDVDDWASKKLRLPGSQAELQEASRLESAPSPYAREGTQLPYRIVFVGGGEGPQLSPAAPDPGVFYYVLSPSADRFWLTGTALDRGTTEAATMLSFSSDDGDRPRVYEGWAPGKPEPEEPAVPEKKP